MATVDSPYYLTDEYGVFQNKQADFQKCFEQIIHFIRRHWRKNPATWMRGYVDPAAGGCFECGGFLLPDYIPPVCNGWIQRLGANNTPLIDVTPLFHSSTSVRRLWPTMRK